MGPPAFSNVGLAADAVFNSGYDFDHFRLNVKTKTKNEVEVKAAIVSDRETNIINGSLEMQHVWSEYNLTFTEKWNTDNILDAEAKLENQLAPGLDLAFGLTFAPVTGEKSARIKSEFRADVATLTGELNFDSSATSLLGSGVIGLQGWLAGCQLGFDATQSKLTTSNFTLGFEDIDFSFITKVNNALDADGTEFVGSVYHKVNEKLEAAVNLSWAAESGQTTFGIGGKYQIDEDATIGAKVNNKTEIGLSYAQKLREGVKITLSSMIDAKNIHVGGHKFGVGLDFEF